MYWKSEMYIQLHLDNTSGGGLLRNRPLSFLPVIFLLKSLDYVISLSINPKD